MIVGQCENGLRYAVRQGGSSVAYCAMSIACGTRAEAESGRGRNYSEGLAHFVEHTLFKGTARRSASAINSCLDKLGGELNAYTTKEEIVLHSTVLKEDIGKAAGLLFELAVCPTFPQKEVEVEKGVVIDEIAGCRDTPSEEIYDRFEELFYPGHPLGRSILGNAKSVKSTSREELAEFVSEFFIPGRMVFTVVSPLSEAAMEKLVRRLNGKWLGDKCGPGPDRGDDSESGGDTSRGCGFRSGACAKRKKPVPAKFEKTVNRKGHQANCIIAAPAPDLSMERERVAAILLANILGGPAGNSALNAVLREKYGLVYNVDCSYTPFSDSGLMEIYIGCERENTDKCIAMARREIARLQSRQLTPRALKAAKKQLLGQLAVSGESGETQCLSMGKSLLAFDSIPDDDSTRKMIEDITAEDVQNAAVGIFAPERISILTYL